jgi:hypothetical protein
MPGSLGTVAFPYIRVKCSGHTDSTRNLELPYPSALTRCPSQVPGRPRPSQPVPDRPSPSQPVPGRNLSCRTKVNYQRNLFGNTYRYGTVPYENILPCPVSPPSCVAVSGGVPCKSHVKSVFWRFNICFLEILFSLISRGSLDPNTRLNVVRSAKWPQDHCCKGESFWIQILLNYFYAGNIGTSIPFNSFFDLIAFLTFSWIIGSITDASVSGSRNV